MRPRHSEVITAAMSFIRASNPTDEVFVVNFGDRVSHGLPYAVPFMAEVGQLRAPLSMGVPAGRTAPKLPPATALIGRFSVPRLRLSVMMHKGIDRKTLQLAVGHIRSTALPGQARNVGMAGHRDTFFRRLKLTGDLKYVVESVIVASPGRCRHKRSQNKCGMMI